MKNLMPFILLLFFFAGQVNLAWATHYCGGMKVASELTVSPIDHNCCDGDPEASNDCCEDQISQADSDDFFKKSEVNNSISPEFVLLAAFIIQGFAPNNATLDDFYSYTPDRICSDKVVLHQTFLI
jgi:hypothetical protein